MFFQRTTSRGRSRSTHPNTRVMLIYTLTNDHQPQECSRCQPSNALHPLFETTPPQVLLRLPRRRRLNTCLLPPLRPPLPCPKTRGLHPARQRKRPWQQAGPHLVQGRHQWRSTMSLTQSDPEDASARVVRSFMSRKGHRSMKIKTEFMPPDCSKSKIFKLVRLLPKIIVATTE